MKIDKLRTKFYSDKFDLVCRNVSNRYPNQILNLNLLGMLVLFKIMPSIEGSH